MPDKRINKVSCDNYKCEIEITLEVLSGKWKALIIWNLYQHTIIRYNEFKRIIPEITQKMLTQQLKELEKYKLISRKDYFSNPPKVEYTLTEIGKSLIPIMKDMDKWGKEYIKIYNEEKDNIN